MSGFSDELAEATRGQALSLYRSLQRLTADLETEQQRALLSEALEEVVACAEEIETANEELERLNGALALSIRNAEEKSRRYEDLFESAPCAYILTSPSGIIREANRAAGELLGVRPAYMCSKPVLVFLVESERRDLHEKLSRVAQDGGIRDWSTSLQPRQGEPVCARINIGVLSDNMGQAVELRWLVQNLLHSQEPNTEQMLAEAKAAHATALNLSNRRIEELEKENRRLTERLQEHGRATDGLVERLRTMENRLNEKSSQVRESSRAQNSTAHYMTKSCAEPLRIAGEQARLLARDLEKSLPATEHARLASLSRLLDLIQTRMAAVATLAGTGDRPLKRETVDTGMIVTAQVDKLIHQFPDRSLEIRLGELPPCNADPELLARLYSHLLSNALKFTRCRDNTTIEIGCRLENKRQVWYVRDNGVGYRKDQEHRLFLPFQSLHRSHGYEGAGVGLALVKQIVNHHGGRIWAEGREDAGATFYFTLA